jgi:site-specific recombinase XerD
MGVISAMVQELLGHNEVSTTMIDTHVLNHGNPARPTASATCDD